MVSKMESPRERNRYIGFAVRRLPGVQIIMAGFGAKPTETNNALFIAKTLNFDRLLSSNRRYDAGDRYWRRGRTSLAFDALTHWKPRRPSSALSPRAFDAPIAAISRPPKSSVSSPRVSTPNRPLCSRNLGKSPPSTALTAGATNTIRTTRRSIPSPASPTPAKASSSPNASIPSPPPGCRR